MNGIHDLGGMDGLTLPERDQGRVLAEEWERLSWGANMALFGVPGLGGLRRELEALPPHLYLTLPYYAKWLLARERMLIRVGHVTEEELANPDGPMSAPNVPPDFVPATAAELVARFASDLSAELESDVPARFAVGDAVVVNNEHPIGHTRAPRYVRGHRGRIQRHHGVHVFQDELPPGVEPGPQHLYTVAFSSRELWGSRGHGNDVVHAELWEYHLSAPA